MFPTDPSAVGVGSAGIEVQPNANGGCNPCLPATGHAAMNIVMAEASVRPLAGDVSEATWRALLTPDDENGVGAPLASTPCASYLDVITQTVVTKNGHHYEHSRR